MERFLMTNGEKIDIFHCLQVYPQSWTVVETFFKFRPFWQELQQKP